MEACDAEKSKFATSITETVGKKFPYWRASGTTAGAVDSDEAHAAVELAVLIQHGVDRNGKDYLCYAHNSVCSYFGQEFCRTKALVFAPQVLEPDNKPEADELFWDASSSDKPVWQWGSNSSSTLPLSLSSFEVMDEMLLALTNRTRFPRMARVVIIGHSAGGQFIQRYSLANRVHDRLTARGLDVQYFAANPSSWTYLDGTRPVLHSGLECGSFCHNTTIASAIYSFAAAPSGNGTQCAATYDLYGYGLAGALVPYMESVGVPAMLQQYRVRRVTYISGSSDVCNDFVEKALHCNEACAIDDHDMDKRCEAYAQGWCRMERAHAFLQHVRLHYKDPKVHALVALDKVGHNGCAVVQDLQAQVAMFGARVLDENAGLVV